MAVDQEPRFLPHVKGPEDPLAAAAKAAEVQREFDDAVARSVQKLRIQQAARNKFDAEQRPPVELPEILTLRERLKRPVPPVAWRIDQLHPAEARIILAAQYKAGKTTTVGNVLRSLADGDPLFGEYKATAVDGNIALVDFEMSGRQIDAWLRDQGIINDDRIIVFPLRGSASAFNLLDDTTRNEWAKRFPAHEIAYVIWDCFRPVVDALGLSEHNEAGRLLTAYDELLKKSNVTESIIVHHMGHMAERSRGDSRLRDWPDVEWRLVREDEEPASPRYFSAFGRDVDHPESQLTFDPDTRHLSISAGSSRNGAKVRAALDAVVKVLDIKPGLSGRQIDAELSGSDHTQKNVRDGLKLGIREGVIKADDGPKNSKIHTLSASVRQSASPVRQRAAESSALVRQRVYSDALHALDVEGSDEQSVRHAVCGVCAEPLDPIHADTGVHPGCAEVDTAA